MGWLTGGVLGSEFWLISVPDRVRAWRVVHVYEFPLYGKRQGKLGVLETDGVDQGQRGCSGPVDPAFNFVDVKQGQKAYGKVSKCRHNARTI